MSRSALPLAAFVLLAGCAGVAAAPPPAAAPFDQTRSADEMAALSPPPTTLKGYLAADALDGEAIIGPPPPAGALRETADRGIYEQTRALEGTPRWEQAKRDQDLWYGGAVHRYACALGKQISPATTPVTYRILQRVELDVRTVGNRPKHLYNRTRPLIDNDRPVCIPRAEWLKTNASYPSGHSMTGWAWGLILGELYPARATAMMAAGREIGDSRVICGAHFQSDVEAGRVLGSAMVARLHAEPAFEKDMAAAKAELARASEAPTNCPA